MELANKYNCAPNGYNLIYSHAKRILCFNKHKDKRNKNQYTSTPLIKKTSQMALGCLLCVVRRLNCLLLHTHKVYHKVAHHANAEYEATLVQVKVRSVVGRGFGGISPFFHAS